MLVKLMVMNMDDGFEDGDNGNHDQLSWSCLMNSICFDSRVSSTAFMCRQCRWLVGN